MQLSEWQHKQLSIPCCFYPYWPSLASTAFQFKDLPCFTWLSVLPVPPASAPWLTPAICLKCFLCLLPSFFNTLVVWEKQNYPVNLHWRHKRENDLRNEDKWGELKLERSRANFLPLSWNPERNCYTWRIVFWYQALTSSHSHLYYNAPWLVNCYLSLSQSKEKAK